MLLLLFLLLLLLLFLLLLLLLLLGQQRSQDFGPVARRKFSQGVSTWQGLVLLLQPHIGLIISTGCAVGIVLCLCA
jgi:hypothetical protein